MIGKRVLNSSDSSGFSCSFEAPTLPEWRSLRQQASQSVFVSAGWIDAWAASYLPRGRWRGPLRYLSVRNARGELVSVFRSPE